MKRRICALTAAVLVVAGPLAAQVRVGQRFQPSRQLRFPFPPVDEARLDPGFKAFRDRFIAAVKARDVSVVLKLMSPQLRSKLESWLSRPRSDFIGGAEQVDWGEFDRLLALGGSFTTWRGAVDGRREFCAPYVYSAYPSRIPAPIEGENDPWVIIKAHVPVRAEPSLKARVVTYLSYELVKADGWLGPDQENGLQWAEVALLNGREGYVREGDIRDPTDYHACFAKVDGQWLMTAFARDVYPAVR